MKGVASKREGENDKDRQIIVTRGRHPKQDSRVSQHLPSYSCFSFVTFRLLFPERDVDVWGPEGRTEIFWELVGGLDRTDR